MEKIGTIGNNALEVYKTNSGNYVGASFVDGRNTKINENKDGTYNVNTISKDGKTEYNKTLTEDELLNDFKVDINNVSLDGTRNAEQARLKYGNNVANSFYSVA